MNVPISMLGSGITSVFYILNKQANKQINKSCMDQWWKCAIKSRVWWIQFHELEINRRVTGICRVMGKKTTSNIPKATCPLFHVSETVSAFSLPPSFMKQSQIIVDNFFFEIFMDLCLGTYIEKIFKFYLEYFLIMTFCR